MLSSSSNSKETLAPTVRKGRSVRIMDKLNISFRKTSSDEEVCFNADSQSRAHDTTIPLQSGQDLLSHQLHDSPQYPSAPPPSEEEGLEEFFDGWMEKIKEIQGHKPGLTDIRTSTPRELQAVSRTGRGRGCIIMKRTRDPLYRGNL